MFSPAARTRLRESLLRAACADKRLSGVAVTGSAAVDREDAWSDIDLVLGVADRANLPEVMADWAATMYREHDAVHDVQLASGSGVYRAFLTASTLQVDLNFVPGAEFGPAGPKFRLVAGAPARRQHATANDATANKATSPDHLAGMGWLYAVQARSCVERGKLWQAERMVSGLREQVLALACLRHGCAAEQATGADQLPSALQARVADCLVRAISPAEVARAFRGATGLLLELVGEADAELGARLAGPLAELARIDPARARDGEGPANRQA